MNTSFGWGSLGDGGAVTVPFPLISMGGGQKLFMFLGDVGARDEFTDAFADIELFEPPLARSVSATDGRQLTLAPGESVNLQGPAADEQEPISS